MKCDKCSRDNLTAKELSIHNKYFHRIGNKQTQVVGTVCPECGTIMQLQEGCEICRACGFSKCG